MTERTNGHIQVYNDGVGIFLSLTCEGKTIELEITPLCAFVLSNELLEQKAQVERKHSIQ